MPKKPRPHEAIIGPATVTLTVADGVFGGTSAGQVTGPIPPFCYILFQCQAATGGQAGYALVQPDGSAVVGPYGPTPSWSGGPASGLAEVVAFTSDVDGTSIRTIISDVASFNVAG